MTASGPILEVRDYLVRKGGVAILDIRHLSVETGEILSLIGPNGAGKSTLLLGLSGISRPHRGVLLFRGDIVDGHVSSLAYRRRIAMVFQEPLLFRASVFDNVASGLRFRGLPGKEVERRVVASLERFSIGHLRDRSARTLSGGEAQRTSLARALAVEPEILLLDEPFASLDPPTREALMDDLEVTLRQLGTTTVMATHDRLEALRLSDLMAVMQAGLILQIGSPEEVMNRPVNEYVASFVGVETILPGEVVSRSIGSIIVATHQREFEAVGNFYPGDQVLLCIRPENVTLSIEAPSGMTSARNHFPGKVERLVPMGPYQKVNLDCGFPLAALVTNHSVEELELASGSVVSASVKATAIHVIARTRRHSPAGRSPK